MGIKLVVTDLDGTLLNKNHEVSEENKKAIRATVDLGVTVTIATGRMYSSALPYAKQLGVDVPIITYNGALIKSVSGEVLFERYINPEVVKEVSAFCHKNNWYLQIYYNDILYFEEQNEKAKGYEALAGIRGVAVGDELYTMQDRIPKMLIITENGEESDDFVKILQERFAGKIFATKSNPTYIEIVHPKVNKAVALDVLMEKLNVTRAEVMAIGDSNNDVPMLRSAGISVAMGNANEEIKSFCTAVTEDYAHDGVAAALRKYILEKA